MPRPLGCRVREQQTFMNKRTRTEEAYRSEHWHRKTGTPAPLLKSFFFRPLPIGNNLFLFFRSISKNDRETRCASLDAASVAVVLPWQYRQWHTKPVLPLFSAVPKKNWILISNIKILSFFIYIFCIIFYTSFFLVLWNRAARFLVKSGNYRFHKEAVLVSALRDERVIWWEWVIEY